MSGQKAKGRRFVLFEMLPNANRDATFIAWTLGSRSGPGSPSEARGEVQALEDASRALLGSLMRRVTDRHARARRRAAARRNAAVPVARKIQELYAVHEAEKLIERIVGKAPYYSPWDR